MSVATWQPTEPLTMAHVGDVYKKQHATWPTAGAWCIDLSHTEKLDSAGLALLLAAIRHSRVHKLKLKFVKWGADAQLLIATKGLTDIFTTYNKD